MSGANTTDLKIAYLCDFSPLDRGMYSGGNAQMYRALQAHVGDVTILSQNWGILEPVRRAVLAAPEAISIRLRWRLHLALAPIIARKLRAELARGHYDVLFCAYSFHSLSRVNAPYPIVTAYSSDATPTIYKNSAVGQNFGSWFKPSRLLDPWVERAEARVFNAVDLALWPSDWLTEAANARYGLAPARSFTVPWGANITDPGTPEPPPTISPNAPVEILFVGRDWDAKGGWITAETVALLRAQGLDARLTVIGCTPPAEISRDALTVVPYLDKSNPDQMAVFQNAFRRAHFMLMPSYESYGFAYCEASAYGLPSLGLRAGGVPIWDGVNGHALPIGANAADFAALIQRYVANPKTHSTLRQSARQTYLDKLNWDAWGQATARHLRDQVNARSRAGPR